MHFINISNYILYTENDIIKKSNNYNFKYKIFNYATIKYKKYPP